MEYVALEIINEYVAWETKHEKQNMGNKIWETKHGKQNMGNKGWKTELVPLSAHGSRLTSSNVLYSHSSHTPP